MRDEIVEYHATTFLSLNIEALLKITFAEFLTDPDRYEDLALELNVGNGLNIHDEMTTVVELDACN